MVFGNIVLPTETASALSREYPGRAFEEQLGVPDARACRCDRAPERVSGRAAGRAGRSRFRAAEAALTRSTRPAARRSTRSSWPSTSCDPVGPTRCSAAASRAPIRSTRRWASRSSARSRRAAGRSVRPPRRRPRRRRRGGDVRAQAARRRPGHGDHIYGVVAGIGLSNDVHGDLLAPAPRDSSARCGWPTSRPAGAPATST